MTQQIINDLLKSATQKNASDVHLVVGRPPIFRIHGELFTSGGEALGEGFESGIVSACAQSCHVENVTHGHATPIDTAVSLKLSAIEVVGCEADEGGDPRVQW